MFGPPNGMETETDFGDYHKENLHLPISLISCPAASAPLKTVSVSASTPVSIGPVRSLSVALITIFLAATTDKIVNTCMKMTVTCLLSEVLMLMS